MVVAHHRHQSGRHGCWLASRPRLHPNRVTSAPNQSWYASPPRKPSVMYRPIMYPAHRRAHRRAQAYRGGGTAQSRRHEWHALDLDGGAEVGVGHHRGQLAQSGPREDHREQHNIRDDDRSQHRQRHRGPYVGPAPPATPASAADSIWCHIVRGRAILPGLWRARVTPEKDKWYEWWEWWV